MGANEPVPATQEHRESEIAPIGRHVGHRAPRSFGAAYAVGALSGVVFGAVTLWSGFWSAVALTGFGLGGLIIAHLVRRIVEGRLDLGGAWRALSGK